MAKKPRSRRFRARVHEAAEDLGIMIDGRIDPSRIDRENGIIRKVLVLGEQSNNTHAVPGVVHGTRYPRQLHERIRGRLHGMHVNFWHKDKNDPDAEVDEFGILKNPVFENGKTYADLHALKSHPKFDRVFEAAEKGMNRHNLSINSLSRGPIVDGWWVIEDMPDFKSVDVVDRGGTTGVLLERHGGAHLMKRNWKQWVQEKIAPRLNAKQQKALKRTFEQDSVPTDTATVETPAEDQMADESAPEDQMRDAFEQMCMQIIQDPSLDAAAVIEKLQPILEHRDAVLAGTEQVASDTGADTGDSSAASTTERKGQGDLAKQIGGMFKTFETKIGTMIDQKVAAATGNTLAKRVCERLGYSATADDLKVLERITDEDTLAAQVGLLKSKGQGGIITLSPGADHASNGDAHKALSGSDIGVMARYLKS